jgi:hypothetical protein
MKKISLFLFISLCGCTTTVAELRQKPPIFEKEYTMPHAKLAGCVAYKVAQFVPMVIDNPAKKMTALITKVQNVEIDMTTVEADFIQAKNGATSLEIRAIDTLVGPSPPYEEIKKASDECQSGK